MAKHRQELYIFSRLALRIATTLCCLLLLSPGLVGAESEPLISDSAWEQGERQSQGFTRDPDSRSATADSAQIGQSLLRMSLGLFLVIALAVLCAWLLKRSGLHRRIPGQRGEHMRLIESLSLGPKRSVSLLQVGQSYVVIGHGEQVMTALTTLDHLETLAQPLPTAEEPEPAPPEPAAGKLQAPANPAADKPSQPQRSVDDFRSRLEKMLGKQ